MTKRVLIVDDDPDILDCLKDLLEPKYEVVVAANGQEALDAVESTRFDLVILDLMMPVVDGEEFAREVRARGIRVPVLVASAGQDVARRAQRLGAVDYLTKPFDIDLMEAKIAAVIDGGRRGGGGQGTPPRGTPKRSLMKPGTGGSQARRWLRNRSRVQLFAAGS
jgi:DNA-binding response OmpR family regulator